MPRLHPSTSLARSPSVATTPEHLHSSVFTEVWDARMQTGIILPLPGWFPAAHRLIEVSRQQPHWKMSRAQRGNKSNAVIMRYGRQSSLDMTAQAHTVRLHSLYLVNGWEAALLCAKLSLWRGLWLDRQPGFRGWGSRRIFFGGISAEGMKPVWKQSLPRPCSPWLESDGAFDGSKLFSSIRCKNAWNTLNNFSVRPRWSKNWTATSAYGGSNNVCTSFQALTTDWCIQNSRWFDLCKSNLSRVKWLLLHLISFIVVSFIGHEAAGSWCKSLQSLQQSLWDCSHRAA